jgi:hypothetical protein
MAYKVENSFPVPDFSGGPGRPSKYPWKSMAVGDSFFVPGKLVENMSPLANYQERKNGVKFTCRTVDGGVRVWRIT